MFLDFDLELLSTVLKLLENNPRSGLPHSFKCQLLNVGKDCLPGFMDPDSVHKLPLWANNKHK